MNIVEARMSDLPASELTEIGVIMGTDSTGLTTTILIKQHAAKAGADFSIVVLENGSEVGGHILSGSVIDPIGLDGRLPAMQVGVQFGLNVGKDHQKYGIGIKELR
jgi:hypothetical protein